MDQSAINFARTQADGLDNIAPTLSQGQAAWQYALSDNFFSPEEQAAVMRRELEPYRNQLESQLAQIGWGKENLAKHPSVEEALFSGRQSVPLGLCITPDLKMNGCLRIIMTENGPDIRVTPVQQELFIPQQIRGINLSKAEQLQLSHEGALPRPVLMPENGTLVPTFLSIDHQTNTIELWRVKTENLPTKLMGIDLTKDQQLQLVGGHAIRLTGLIDRQGEPFDATVSISATRQQLQFSDVNRLDVGLKPDSQYSQQIALNNEGAKTDLIRSQEVTVGSTTLSNNQRETVEKLLESNQGQQARGSKLQVH